LEKCTDSKKNGAQFEFNCPSRKHYSGNILANFLLFVELCGKCEPSVLGVFMNFSAVIKRIPKLS
jgi:hypothetical protein